MKKILISLTILIAYTSVSFHSIYITNAVSNMHWSLYDEYAG